ncbi:hypothetical protein [Solimonas flava]|uniref:hypothetical protein n=1 Tax=Solimonas flava TaxID=415849 RepID=UPI000410DB47|nr:hypothetical protein [Solimonas flava]
MTLSRQKIAVIAMVLVVAGVMAAAVAAAIVKNRRWHAWADIHCKVIGEFSGSAVPIVSVTSDGKLSTGTMFEPDKIAYRCDDGKTYWR